MWSTITFVIMTHSLFVDVTHSFHPIHVKNHPILRTTKTSRKNQLPPQQLQQYWYYNDIKILAKKGRKSSLSVTKTTITNGSSPNTTILNTVSPRKKGTKRNLPKKLIRLYTDYAKRLWKETNPEARKFVDSHRVAKSILLVQQLLLKGEPENTVPTIVPTSSSRAATTTIPEPQRQQLLDACAAALESIGIIATTTTTSTATTDATQTQSQEVSPTVLSNGEYHSPVNGDTGTRQFVSLSTTTATATDDRDSTALSLSNDRSAPIISTTTTTNITPNGKPAKTRRSIGFGAAMGLAVTGWVFSGSYIFTGLFTLMTALGQLEYYRMVMNTGIFPARRISVIGACSMFLAALFTPDLHQIVLPISGLWAMVWFLTMRRTLTPIPEIATTFTGLFYLGYVPSFWVRIRLIGMGREPTRLAPITGPMLKFLEAQGKTLPSFIPQAIHLPITTGAIFIFWTWLCLAFSDVGAYFVGRTFGKTKLGLVFPAAGATSPNKTIEGVVGGCALSAVLAIIGAWVQRWPYPILTGTVHGLCLGLLGLLGDLTASMLKRDAGLKDFGDLLPEHGGIMDRVDSFIWTAPYSYVELFFYFPLSNHFRNTHIFNFFPN